MSVLLYVNADKYKQTYIYIYIYEFLFYFILFYIPYHFYFELIFLIAIGQTTSKFLRNYCPITINSPDFKSKVNLDVKFQICIAHYNSRLRQYKLI